MMKTSDESVRLQEGPFTRKKAQAVAAQYSNVGIENDQGTHFQLAVRFSNGMLCGRVWNFESDAGWEINRYIDPEGIKK